MMQVLEYWADCTWRLVQYDENGDLVWVSEPASVREVGVWGMGDARIAARTLRGFGVPASLSPYPMGGTQVSAEASALTQAIATHGLETMKEAIANAIDQAA